MKAMRNITISLLLLTGNAISQTLQVPSTPAFSILDFEPTAVMRPNSYKDLSTDLLTSFDADGKLVLNAGIEVMPYWLQSRPELDRSLYLNARNGQLIKQSFALSAATVKDSVTNANFLGAGFRLSLINGRPSDEFRTADLKLYHYEKMMNAVGAARNFVESSRLNSLQETRDFIFAVITSHNEQFSSGHDSIVPSNVSDRAKIIAAESANKFDREDRESLIAFCLDLINRLNDESTPIAQEVITLSRKRIGLSIEMAGAAKFNTSKSDQALQKAGFWVNANNYFSETDAWTLTGRIMFNTADTLSVNTDVGIGYIKVSDRYNLSVEGLVRWYRTEMPDVNLNNVPITRVERDFTYRLAVQASYKVTELLSFNLSLGKDFDDHSINQQGFFSIAGINYTVFNQHLLPQP